jgi:oligopeptide transport system substrate-binding protein
MKKQAVSLLKMIDNRIGSATIDVSGSTCNFSRREKNMKKLISFLMAALMVFALVGCGGTSNNDDPNNIKLADTKNLVQNDPSELQTMDYVVTALATDHEYNVNFVDGLVETDQYGAYVGSIAESWEANEDSTEWTFHLRKGANWVTNTGEVYAETVAQDFITGLRHAAEFNSGTASVVYGTVAGFQEYMTNQDWSDEAWSKVGISAPDDYTVVYTLENPVPYFYTVVEYAVFYPINQEFLESKGSGCKLGSPDTNNCSFGTTAPDSILYNGAYILDTLDVKSQTVIKKNEQYWDAEHVYLDTVTTIFDDGSDSYSVMRAFEQGINAAAGLNASWEDFQEYHDKYEKYLTTSLPNFYAFGVVFNYNRQTFDHTNYAADETLRANTIAAIRNENFRKALRASIDEVAVLSATLAEEVAAGTTRNLNGVYNLVSTSDGTPYGKLVENAYKADTGEDVDLSDGHYEWYNPDKAKEYIEAAKAEGIQFPIHLDMLNIETSERLTKQNQALKKSVEDATDGQIIIELVMASQDDVENIAYYNEDPAACDYDISNFTGWGPDCVDPKTFVQIYSPVEGYYMHAMGLTDTQFSPDVYGTDDDIKEAVGWNGYEALYEAADEITGDLDARYEEFAKADAYLIEHCLYIPTSMQTRALRVSHVVPFTAPYSSGISQYCYKGMQLQEDMVTTEQYNEAYQKFLNGGK